MGISDKSRKILWVQGGGMCAICKVQVVTPGTDSDDPSIFGEEAHIVARSSGGPRAGGLPKDKLNHHSNLILLCSKDHKRVDDQPNYYTVERLQAIKSKHEAWVRSLTGAHTNRPRLVPDPLYPQPKVLKLILNGNMLWNMIKESVAHEYAMPGDLSEDDEELVVDFLDLVKDLMDISQDLVSVRENRDAEKMILAHMNRLIERDLIVGAYVRHLLYQDGHESGPMPWPMLRVEVQRAKDAELADENGTRYPGKA